MRGGEGFSLPSSGWSDPGGPLHRRTAALLRAGYLILAGWVIAAAVQFQYLTMRQAGKAAPPPASQARGRAGASASQEQLPEKATKGAIGRWRKAVRHFWAGENIYLPVGQAVQGGVALHPNMPFVVILLTPFAYLPIWAMALGFNLLKLATIAAAVFLCVRLAGQANWRTPQWAVLLALLWSVKPIVADIQHGNTNVFVLGALALHLWLYRRGWDLASGAALAPAVCLKLTPALFLGYWLYQRNWRLLAGAVAALLLLVAVIPPAAVGPAHGLELTRTWWDNLVVPGGVEGSWYPIHVNQSIIGVVGRYFLDGPGGDIFWGPDDNPYSSQKEHGWITLVALAEWGTKLIVRILQLALLAGAAWAIGWRKLPRDDARRMLHYALVLLGMMLLNQRTWGHHAAVLLIANFGIWQAIASGNISPPARRWALGLAIAAGACMWLNAGGAWVALAWLAGRSVEVGKAWADRLDAYGPTFYYFLLLFIAATILAGALRRSRAPDAQSCGLDASGR
jgi:hypothetical protein